MRMKTRKSLTITIPDETKEKLRQMSDYAQQPMSVCMENIVDLLYPDWEHIVDKSKTLGQDYLHYLVERDRIDPLKIKVQLLMGQEGTPIVVSDPKRLPVNKKDLPPVADKEADVFTQYVPAEEPPKEKLTVKDETTAQMDNRIADMQRQLEALQKEKSEYEQKKEQEEIEEQEKADFAKQYIKNTKDTDKGAVIKQGNFLC